MPELFSYLESIYIGCSTFKVYYYGLYVNQQLGTLERPSHAMVEARRAQ
jgi:hypothetical protein